MDFEVIKTYLSENLRVEVRRISPLQSSDELRISLYLDGKEISKDFVYVTDYGAIMFDPRPANSETI